MNCQKFETVVSDLARSQMMEAELRVEALTHSAECSSCSSRLHDEEILTRGLRSLATEMNSLEPPASVEARLLGAFRQPQVVVPLPVARSHRRYWLTAVAALLLIVFGVVAIRWRGPGAEAPKQQAVVTPSEQEEKTAVVSASTGAEERDVADDPRPKQRKRHTLNRAAFQAGERSTRIKNNNVVANHVTSEVATEFVPLGYLNAASFQDGGQIVRVELPRTTLANFGFPVNMDRYNEKVKADVLLGVDGRARAIRFVQDKRLE